MSVLIGMEDLVANALIEVLEKKAVREIDFETLTLYGINVVSIMKRKSEKVVLLLSQFYTNELIRNYSRYFYIREYNDKSYIALQDGIMASDLRTQFRAYLSIDLLLAFINTESLRILGVENVGQII